jgi:hypothetical protein
VWVWRGNSENGVGVDNEFKKLSGFVKECFTIKAEKRFFLIQK